MAYCLICNREHDERCDLCIYKDDPKSKVPDNLKESPCKTCTLDCDTTCEIYEEWEKEE